MERHKKTEGFVRPRNLIESLKIISYLRDSGQDYIILAGGTDLLVKNRYSPFNKHNQMLTAIVVDITAITELKNIYITNESIIIGSLVTHAQLASSEDIRNYIPILAEAAGEVGSPQIRNRGTIGGNICNASPAADLIPILTALEAEVKIASFNDQKVFTRKVLIEELISGPFATTLGSDELLISVEVPLKNPLVGCFHMKETGHKDVKSFFNESKTFWGSGYTKLGRRNAMSVSIINIAFLLEFEQLLSRQGYIVSDSRLSIGAVTPKPTRFTASENILKGLVITQSGQIEDTKKLELAAHTAVEEMIRISGVRKSTKFKSSILYNLIPALISGTAKVTIENYQTRLNS